MSLFADDYGHGIDEPLDAALDCIPNLPDGKPDVLRMRLVALALLDQAAAGTRDAYDVRQVERVLGVKLPERPQ